MSEHITLRGFVGKDPESHLFEDGTMVARFRLATTSRRFDAATNTWHDTSTNWYTVRCFRSLAMHVMASVRCGHPVVVTGKLGINEWQSENGPRTVVQVDAAAVGHDLSFGTANFSRSSGRAQRQDVQDGGPHEGARTDGGSNPQSRGAGGTRDGGDVGPGDAQGRAGTEPGEDRYRDTQALGLGEEGFVDLESGAVLAVAQDDDTFRGLTGDAHERGAATGDRGRSSNDAGGTDADGGDADQETAADREPAVASH